MPEELHSIAVKAQFICTLYAGTFFGYTLCHIGDDIFINALIGGMADCLANITSANVKMKLGLITTYRLFALIAFLLWSSLQWFHVMGFTSYVMVFFASYCLGCCLNYGTATIVDQTPPDKLKGFMTQTVTIGATLSCTIPVFFLVWQQPIPMSGMCTALAGTVVSTYYLQGKAPEPKKEEQGTLLEPKK